MRFVISVVDSQTRAQHSPEEIRAIDEFNVKLKNAHQRIFAMGLDSPSTAAVFDNRTGENIVVAGPFIESVEFFSGFWIIETESLPVAQGLAAEGSRACNRKVELRPLLS